MPRTIRHWTPRYVANRLMYAWHERRSPDAPWLTRHAVAQLDQWLQGHHVGLEWGSGRSTLWFAARVAHLTSIEHDAAWHQRVADELARRGIANVKYCFAPLEARAADSRPRYVALGDEGAAERYDFILVDGKHRDLCTEAALGRLKPGGLLVIDNAERYFPRRTAAPSSMLRTGRQPSALWSRLGDELAGWGCLWTTNGVCDTALFTKPAAAGSPFAAA